MKNSLSATIRPIQRIALVCICTLAIHGCSSSSESGPSDVQPSDESASSVSLASQGAPVTEAQSSTATPDSSSPTATRVDFDITVPAYSSDELQVQLTWGDINTAAAWVRDESWAISETLPADTENLLVVTFSDQNGAITLGRVEQSLRTGANATDTLVITADQFLTDVFDDDADGTSNLSELIEGLDPLVANTAVTPLQSERVQANLEPVADKTFHISWQPVEGAQFYRILENPDGVSGFNPIGGDLESSVLEINHRVALYQRVNAQYIVQACNAQSCIDSTTLSVSGTLSNAIGYFKASNTGGGFIENTHGATIGADRFGGAIALSADGKTLAIGATNEDSNATGVNGDHNDNSAQNSGAAYVYAHINGSWQLQAYLKASNTGADDAFGHALSLSADGNLLAIGSPREDSGATGINGDQGDTSVQAGAVYLFERTNNEWQQTDYVKASNTSGVWAQFGVSLDLSSDGNTLAVGSTGEDSASRVINSGESDITSPGSGAVYVFTRNNREWAQQAYLKTSNNEMTDNFGSSVSISGDGRTIAASAPGEDSLAAGINGDENDNSGLTVGAVYVFFQTEGTWRQQAYVKADSSSTSDSFGGDSSSLNSLSLSEDGNTLAVGVRNEDSDSTGINGSPHNDLSSSSGAVYVYVRNDNTWERQAYLKASNALRLSLFGTSVSLSADGNLLAVTAASEWSSATGINGDQFDVSSRSGAGYVFTRSNGSWQQTSYLKASNTDPSDRFGFTLSLSSDGGTIAIGAIAEGSAATGVNGDQSDDSAPGAGAVFLY